MFETIPTFNKDVRGCPLAAAWRRCLPAARHFRGDSYQKYTVADSYLSFIHATPSSAFFFVVVETSGTFCCDEISSFCNTFSTTGGISFSVFPPSPSWLCLDTVLLLVIRIHSWALLGLGFVLLSGELGLLLLVPLLLWDCGELELAEPGLWLYAVRWRIFCSSQL